MIASEQFDRFIASGRCILPGGAWGQLPQVCQMCHQSNLRSLHMHAGAGAKATNNHILGPVTAKMLPLMEAAKIGENACRCIGRNYRLSTHLQGKCLYHIVSLSRSFYIRIAARSFGAGYILPDFLIYLQLDTYAAIGCRRMPRFRLRTVMSLRSRLLLAVARANPAAHSYRICDHATARPHVTYIAFSVVHQRSSIIYSYISSLNHNERQHE